MQKGVTGHHQLLRSYERRLGRVLLPTGLLCPGGLGKCTGIPSEPHFAQHCVVAIHV